MRRALATAIGKLASAVPSLARDLAAVAGAGLVSYGAWLAYEPAGYAILGLILLAASILSARRPT